MQAGKSAGRCTACLAAHCAALLGPLAGGAGLGQGRAAECQRRPGVGARMALLGMCLLCSSCQGMRQPVLSTKQFEVALCTYWWLVL